MQIKHIFNVYNNLLYKIKFIFFLKLRLLYKNYINILFDKMNLILDKYAKRIFSDLILTRILLFDK